MSYASATAAAIIASLNNNEPRILSTAEAVAVARQSGIVRYIKTDFCWMEAKKNELTAMLNNANPPGVLVCKAHKFAHFFFSNP